MNILIIDDMPEQLEHAIKVLSGPGREVKVANGWTEGEDAIEKGNCWDMVLTDLSMPAVSTGLGDEGLRHVGEPTPYGFSLALLALKHGVKKIAIVSNGQSQDCNHHNHPIFWSVDDLHGEIIPGRLWAFTGYKCPHMNKDSLPGVDNPYYIKDWASIFKEISA